MTMSNGGGEIEKEHKQLQEKSKVGGSDFDIAVAKIAVAQICESLGFQGFHQSALETLSDIAVRYIHNLGKTAHSYTSLAGRTESNAFDVVQGLEDLGSGLGFVSSSDLDHCLASSGMAMDIVNYVQDADSVPFAYSLPHFPVIKKRKLASSFCQNGDEPPDRHIPSWLPAFPNQRVISKLKEGDDIKNGLERNIHEFPGGKEETERSLKNSQENLVCSTLAGTSTVCNAQAAEGTQTAERNPFLAKPLSFGEKEVSIIVPPDRISVGTPKSNPDLETNLVSNHVSDQETRSPIAEPVKNCVSDSERRPLIRFRLGSTRKPLCPNRDLASLEGRGLEKTSFLFREDEEEWKKTKPQKIVTQSGENRTEQFEL